MGDKVKDSLQIENFVIDFSSENKIVAIENYGCFQDIERIIRKRYNKRCLIENRISGYEYLSWQRTDLYFAGNSFTCKS